MIEIPAENSPGKSIYRGAIRHIQTDEEVNFSTWKEAVTFIRRFVPLEEDQTQQS